MTFFVEIFLLVLLALTTCAFLDRRRASGRKRHGRRQPCLGAPPPASGFPARKPDWVRDAVLALHEQSGLSHRKLADAFNLRYFASTGISVGRTWVRQLLQQHAQDALHRQQEKSTASPNRSRATAYGALIRLA